MSFGDEPANWTFSQCESCAKNAGDRVEMVKERIDPSHDTDHFVCPQCGATKRL
jgi:predicted RNA-binding Zn-ribbon protein involved in translation (DUF1610 family)